jgi:hypothetical protein
MAVGGASGAGSAGKSGGASSAGKSGGAGAGGATGKTGKTGRSKDAGASPSSVGKTDSKSSTPSSTEDKSTISTEAKTPQTEEAKAKAKADSFESRFSAAFDDADQTPEVEAAQQDLEAALQDYTEAKTKSDPDKKGGVVDTAAGLTKAAAEKVADAAQKARKGRRAMRASRKIGSNLNMPASVSRFGRGTAGLAAGVSALSGATDLALNDAPLNDKVETSLKAADDVASAAQMARSLGATSRFGIGTLGRMAPALGTGALAYEGINQLATSQSRADTWAGSMKTAAAATMVGGMTSVIGAAPAAVASGAMYGAALAIDNRDAIDAGIHAGLDTLAENFGVDVPRNLDPNYEKTARGYRRI